MKRIKELNLILKIIKIHINLWDYECFFFCQWDYECLNHDNVVWLGKVWTLVVGRRIFQRHKINPWVTRGTWPNIQPDSTNELYSLSSRGTQPPPTSSNPSKKSANTHTTHTQNTLTLPCQRERESFVDSLLHSLLVLTKVETFCCCCLVRDDG